MTNNEIVDIFHDADRIQSADSIEEIAARFTACMKALGYQACLITRLPAPHTMNWHAHIVANRWPQDWFERYNFAGHYRNDPCVAQCRRTADPFLWSQIDADELAAPARTVMGEATEFGLRQGICVPIHTPLSPPAAVTAAGDVIDTSPIAQQSVYLLARAALSAASRLAGRNAVMATARLSRREAEILQWFAAGKSAWEISVILSVSQHTILTHLKNIKQKLAAANIVHAVVEGLRRREIEL